MHIKIKRLIIHLAVCVNLTLYSHFESSYYFSFFLNFIPLQLESKFTDLELEHPVEGEITIPGAIDDDVDFSTLDEPVKDTVVRCSSVILLCHSTW